jgi:hypothetical protein
MFTITFYTIHNFYLRKESHASLVDERVFVFRLPSGFFNFIRFAVVPTEPTIDDHFKKISEMTKKHTITRGSNMKMPCSITITINII